MVIFVFAAYFHIPIFYLLVNYPTDSVCTIVSPRYTKIYAIFLALFLAVLPPFLMIVLCGTTLIFLRRQRRRVMPINQVRLRQRDNQLLKMLLLYVAFHLICTIPFNVALLIAVYQLPASSPLIILLFRLFILLFNTNFATSFYIYTLGTPFYRHELVCLIKDIKNRFHRMIRRYHNQPRPHICC
jgi:hypothetical protein